MLSNESNLGLMEIDAGLQLRQRGSGYQRRDNRKNPAKGESGVTSKSSKVNEEKEKEETKEKTPK